MAGGCGIIQWIDRGARLGAGVISAHTARAASFPILFRDVLPGPLRRVTGPLGARAAVPSSMRRLVDLTAEPAPPQPLPEEPAQAPQPFGEEPEGVRAPRPTRYGRCHLCGRAFRLRVLKQ